MLYDGGSITLNPNPSPFSKVMRCTGLYFSDEELDAIFKEIDLDGSGSLGFVEFADMMTGPPSQACTTSP